ncbi:unnamed protein product [Amoebophrya sp. A25]|nr:unnamed protein product [Amoebophrya sp. A25]|eukprot:GSA25T00012087001.1
MGIALGYFVRAVYRGFKFCCGARRAPVRRESNSRGSAGAAYVYTNLDSVVAEGEGAAGEDAQKQDGKRPSGPPVTKDVLPLDAASASFEDSVAAEADLLRDIAASRPIRSTGFGSLYRRITGRLSQNPDRAAEGPLDADSPVRGLGRKKEDGAEPPDIAGSAPQLVDSARTESDKQLMDSRKRADRAINIDAEDEMDMGALRESAVPRSSSADYRANSRLSSKALASSASARTLLQHIAITAKAITVLAVVLSLFWVAEQVAETTNHAVRLEPLLVSSFLACLVGHDPDIREELSEIITTFTPHVFLPFFTITGASLRLRVLFSLADTALLIFVLRFAAVMAGCYVASVFLARGRRSQNNSDRGSRRTENEESDATTETQREVIETGQPSDHVENFLAKNVYAMRHTMGLTMLSQAGVALGLALETVALFSDWGQDVADVVIAVVCLSQLIGPAFAVLGLQQITTDV